MAHPHALFARDPGDDPMRIPRRSALVPPPVAPQLEEDIMIPPSDADEDEDEIMIPPSDEDEDEDDIMIPPTDEDDDDEEEDAGRSKPGIIDLTSADDDGGAREKPVILKNASGRETFNVFPSRFIEERSYNESPAVLADHFRTNGYIFVRDVLSHALRADLHNIVTSVDMLAMFKRRAGTTTKVLTGDEFDKTGLPNLPGFKAKYSARILRVLSDAPLLYLLNSLVKGLSFDSTPRDWTLHFRARTFKSYTGVHADWFNFRQMNSVPKADESHRSPHRIRPVMTVWIPLSRCNAHTGGLVLSPKSHVNSIASPDKMYSSDFDPATAPWASAEYNLGDVLVFEGRTVHAGAVNTTKGQTRFSLDFRLIPKIVQDPL